MRIAILQLHLVTQAIALLTMKISQALLSKVPPELLAYLGVIAPVTAAPIR